MSERSTDRIKRLVAALLNDNGRTDAEAELARQKAAELMAENGLTKEEVLAEERDMGRWDCDISRHRWIIMKFVGQAIAGLTDTKGWVMDLRTARGRRSDRKRYSFAGYSCDIEWAEWLAEHILETGMHAAKPYKGDRVKSDFLTAYSIQVCRRVNALAESLNKVREQSTGKELMVIKDALVKQYVEEIVSGLRPMRGGGRSISEHGAYAAGEDAGRSVSLSKPMGSTTGPLLLGGK